MLCPVCNGNWLIPIVYGNHGQAAYDLAAQGLIRLGGSVAFGDESLWYCRDCNSELPGNVRTPSSSGGGISEHRQMVESLFNSYAQPSDSERTSMMAQMAITNLARCLAAGATEVRVSRSDHAMKTILTNEEGESEQAGPPTELFEAILRHLAEECADNEWLRASELFISKGDSLDSVIVRSGSSVALPTATLYLGAVRK